MEDQTIFRLTSGKNTYYIDFDHVNKYKVYKNENRKGTTDSFGNAMVMLVKELPFDVIEEVMDLRIN